MKFEFKPEDFYVCDEIVDGSKCTKEHEISLSDKECADIANARLAQMLESAPVVYGYSKDVPQIWTANRDDRYLTHQAKLVQIKRIGE